MRIFGWLLVIFSLIPLIAGLGMDTSVATSTGGRIHNIGLMRDQQNALLIGALLLIVGVAFLLATRRRQVAPPTVIESRSDDKQCPFCAERIKAAAVICRFCGRDLPAADAPAKKSEPIAPSIERMAELGITFDGTRYHFGPYSYDQWTDAAAYARKHRV